MKLFYHTHAWIDKFGVRERENRYVTRVEIEKGIRLCVDAANISFLSFL